MTTVTVSAHNAIVALRKVVADRGLEYIDPNGAAPGSGRLSSCVYIDQSGNPSCGVAQAFNNHLGVTMRRNFEGSVQEIADSIDEYQPEDERQDFISDYFDLDDLLLDKLAVDILQTFQTNQDFAKTYETALRGAEEYAAQNGLVVPEGADFI